MFKQTVIEYLERDLRKLKEEIAAYKDEKTIWAVHEGISNSGGNLCLHLIGNLNHFVGTQLGNTGYVRNRDLEFSDKNVPQAKLLADVDRTIVVVNESLDKLTEEDFKKEYPIEFQNKKVSTMYILVQMLTHLDYHLGQINYHRRLLSNL